MKPALRETYNCTCGDAFHHLVITPDLDEKYPEWNTVSFSLVLEAHGIIAKIKIAWNVLRGQRYEYHDIILDLPEFRRLVDDVDIILQYFDGVD